MTRLAVFASYDKQGIVHDYVISYLKRLKQVADKVIFIADNNANDIEKQKLNGLVEFYDFMPHGEYDFGSYKRGYQYAERQGLLQDVEELIFCNDSCFSVMDFNHMFEEMKQRDCDFWGATDSFEIKHHLQSYFLVFKKNVFTCKDFIHWIGAITRQNDFGEIVNTYEVPLKSFLEKLGFKGNAFIEANNNIGPMSISLTLYRQKLPLLKRKIFVVPNTCNESVRKILQLLKKETPRDYFELCKYYKLTFNHFFPIVFPKHWNGFIRFIYQRKVTKSGKLCLKICKIPVYIKRINK